MPELAHFPARAEADMPLTTSSPSALPAGTTTPPGHMQNEYTPRPSCCDTKLYSAAGRYLPLPLRLWYCMLSISVCGCSRRTPTAMPLGSMATSRPASTLNVSWAECPVASKTASAAASPRSVITPRTSPSAMMRSRTRVSKRTSPPLSRIVCRMFLMTCGRRSLPICGCASMRMSGEAPCCTNS